MECTDLNERRPPQNSCMQTLGPELVVLCGEMLELLGHRDVLKEAFPFTALVHSEFTLCNPDHSEFV